MFETQKLISANIPSAQKIKALIVAPLRYFRRAHRKRTRYVLVGILMRPCDGNIMKIGGFLPVYSRKNVQISHARLTSRNLPEYFAKMQRASCADLTGLYGCAPERLKRVVLDKATCNAGCSRDVVFDGVL